MSWFRSAMNKAVEVGNRTVKSYADSVVQQAGQAVTESPKILQDHIGNSNLKNFTQIVKMLEEASVSCKGPERVQLLRRWVTALTEIEKLSGLPLEDKEENIRVYHPLDASEESLRKQSLVLYYGSDLGGEQLNFRDVFLYSQALEGMTICMILEAPNEEEVSLLLELFRLCLAGGKGVHNAIVSAIQDLAKAFSIYQDEVLVKREELLQFAKGAITGLKVNADLGRIDAAVSTLKKRRDKTTKFNKLCVDGRTTTIVERNLSSIEDLKEALSHVTVCSRLEGLLLKRKTIKYGDSPEVHTRKIDKLKVLSESLATSSIKVEKRIRDNRSHKEEALKSLGARTSEVTKLEKDLTIEISRLEKQRDALQAELKKVNISLAAAQARLQNVKEERDQFYEANDQLVAHLKTKEDEHSKSIVLFKVEADVVRTWMNFLGDTWALQCSLAESQEKEVNDELHRHEEYFMKLTTELLSSYERELKPCIERIEKYVENLRNLSEGSSVASNVDGEDYKLSPRNNLEEEYLEYETKIVTTFSVVDKMREQFYPQKGRVPRKDDSKVKVLFDHIEKLRQEFESIERPDLNLENPAHEAESLSGEKSREFVSQPTGNSTVTPHTGKTEQSESEPSAARTEQILDFEAELARLESEFGKVNPNYATEGGAWDLDELERELRYGYPVTTK